MVMEGFFNLIKVLNFILSGQLSEVAKLVNSSKELSFKYSLTCELIMRFFCDLPLSIWGS